MNKFLFSMIMVQVWLMPFWVLADDKPITIMPLGDSITEGGGRFVVYRYPLMEKLVAAGYNVKYVGSKNTRPVKNSKLGELQHEGYGGKNVQFLASRFKEWYTQNPADIVLIHAGHNQFADKKPIPGIIKSTRSIIETARSINPKVTILLAQVIPSGKLPKYSYIPDLNKELKKLADEMDKPDQRVISVDQAEGFNWETDTVHDHVHPNAQGAEKMATKWFEALKIILPPPNK